MKTTCQICAREIKANTGVIAHHGYSRPGNGWQTSSCFGARHLPYEESCNVIPDYIHHVKMYVESQRQLMEDIVKNPPETLSFIYGYMDKTPKVLNRPEGFSAEKNTSEEYFYRGSWTYESEHYNRFSKHKREVKNGEIEIKRMEKRLADWKAPV